MKRVVVVLPLTPVTATNRNAAVVASGEHAADDRFADGARRAARWFEVHPQARGRVHFDHDAVLLFHGAGDVGHNHINAGDVEADHFRRFNGAGDNFGMDVVGHVARGAAGAEVCVAADENFRLVERDRLRRVALFGHDGERNRIERNFAQAGRVVFAAARVLVGDMDQFFDRVYAVADDVGRFAARCGDQLAANDEHAIIVAWGVLLDDDRFAFEPGRFIGRADLIARIAGSWRRRALDCRIAASRRPG